MSIHLVNLKQMRLPFQKRQLEPNTIQRGPIFPNLFLMVAFLADLITPILIWREIIPDTLRWIADMAIITMIAIIPLRMLAFNHIPRIFWLIVILSLVGIFTSLFSGQGISATLWGWWLMFQYPLVGLFSYLEPHWPKDMGKKIIPVLIILISIEVIVQIAQYLGGEIPGDNLAGTFGKNGTGDLVLFLILVLCFAFGDWLASQRWKYLLAALFLGLISSVLGEMKLFFLAMALIGIIGVIAFILRGKQVWRLIPLAFILTITLSVVIPLYNRIVPSASQVPLDRFISDPEVLSTYLTFVNKTTTGTEYYYDVGRNYAIAYGWDKINNRPDYLSLGYGLGARSESRSLGFVGRGIEEGELGVNSGTSLLVILQETGLLGIIVFSSFFLIIIIQLFRHIRKNPKSQANNLRLGIIIFTLFWPIWLWYNAAWTLRVPMLLYWGMLGYVISEHHQEVTLMNKKSFGDQF